MQFLKSIDKSRLFQRLKTAETSNETARDEMVGKVRRVAEEAGWISEQIVRHMPQYTLHNDTHLFNVLSIVEELLPDETLSQLSPLECALCIMAVFTHDLGMALSDEEFKDINGVSGDTPRRREYLRFRDGFSEEVRQIGRLRIENDAARAELIEGHIRAEYLRRTHAAMDGSRIRFWLKEIKKQANSNGLFQCANLDFEEQLVWIAVSHNQNVAWLREQLVGTQGPADAFCSYVGTEQVNFAFPGLLLRLADYMDFDATRTPGILFRNLGIDNKISVQEWQKHLAITGAVFRQHDKYNELLYVADSCSHPVVEKTIRNFVADIQREVMLVRDELEFQQRLLGNSGERYILRLPDKVEVRVSPKVENGKPIYIYSDLQFRLDQDEILQLLMGEGLYGDPSLCILELLQNSLDAVEMRKLRLQLRSKDEHAQIEPTDSGEENKEPQIRLSWGKDEASGQEYIRVADNGTGMTRRMLETFFTQIGKSYYRSPDFERERQMMCSHKLYATPISQFGIGILSCFMIAERLEVSTRPGGADNAERTPYDATVLGTGSLFWLKPGTRTQQGTTITIYLKSNFRLIADERKMRDRLRDRLGFSENKAEKEESEDKREVIDVAYEAVKHIVWPTAPILLGLEDGTDPLTIDDRLHWDVLNLIDVRKVVAKAAAWGCPPEMIGNPRWAMFDWDDTEDAKNATGSRIRLIYPRHFAAVAQNSLPADPPEHLSLCQINEIAAFTETTLPDNVRNRIMVKGVNVAQSRFVGSLLDTASRIGCYLWVDFRGDAAPRLTADRATAMPRTDVENWEQKVRAVFQRWRESIAKQVGPEIQDQATLLYLTHGLWEAFAPAESSVQWSLQTNSSTTWNYTATPQLKNNIWRVTQLFQGTAHDRAHDRAPDRAPDLFSVYEPCLLNHLFNEAFNPTLERSWPLFYLFALRGYAGNALLTAPGRLQLELESDGRTIHFADSDGKKPERLHQFGYDLVFPLTAVPLGRLRRDCAVWRTDCSYRALGVLPFLFLGQIQSVKEQCAELRQVFSVPHIHALLPPADLWDKPFADWTEENLDQCFSALWDIDHNTVVWAQGAHTPAEMKQIGLPIEKFTQPRRSEA